MTTERALFIVRPAAEIATKRHRTRARFQRVLEANVAEMLSRRELDPSVSLELGRIFVEVSDRELAAATLARTFGVASFSRVERTVPSDLESIVRGGHELWAERVRGKRYAVRAKRQGPNTPSSLAIEQSLGAALNPGATVDLEQPDVTLRVEVLGQRAHLLSDRQPGPGGLPGGVQGRGLVLISGGFDSAVAAWRVMKRGVALDFVLFNLGGRAYERMVLSVVRVLTETWCAGHHPMLHVVDFTGIAAAIRKYVRAQYWQVVLKRLMYRAGELVAREIGAEALVTGESIGQVSSQTLANLAAIQPAAGLPILRPLVGHDKTEIIAEARLIGTARLSERVQEYCAMSAGFPVTASTSERVDRQEQRLAASLVEDAARARRVIDPATVTREDRDAYLFTQSIPDGAIVIDCRPPHLFRAWHCPGARREDPSDLIENLRRLDKGATYVVYCAHGGQAAHLAELMQRSGYDAYAFEGGAAALERSLGEVR